MAFELIIGAIDLGKYVRAIELEAGEKTFFTRWDAHTKVFFKKGMRNNVFFFQELALIARKPQTVYIQSRGEVKTYPNARVIIKGKSLEISKTALGGFVIPEFNIQGQIAEMGRSIAAAVSPLTNFRNAAIQWETARLRPRPENDPPYRRGEYIGGIDIGVEDGITARFELIHGIGINPPQRIDLTALEQDGGDNATDND